MELEKKYDPSQFEERLYSFWQEKNYFKPSHKKGAKSYTISMPPPNITGQLHMGHALDATLQDILIRYKRMCGFNTLWVPGTDHAAIATESKIVAAMKKEGLSKDDLGRDGFLKRAWEWNRVYGGRITEQLKKMGASCDWERQRFTLDEGCSKAVQKVFIDLYNKGLIYRGKRIINWCPHCKTSISDAEVEYEDQKGHFWHIRYPFSDGSGYVTVATTRPETMLGDTAVAVNPKDERYTALVGKTLILPLVNREIPVIADEYVDAEFGTGCVKITPAHDPNDFEVGARHELPLIDMMTDEAKVTDEFPAYAGMDRYDARKAILRDLEAGGFLVKTEAHEHSVGTCYRCHTTIEPRASLQWFVKMTPLAKPAIKAVEDGEIRFVPERFSKNYLHWMENIRDWCISRQLWWGHRIPAYYCDDCGELVVTPEAEPACPKCGKKMRQDPDTLDTWFSSALWPFSTLGWPDDTCDLREFYPTSTLVTGYDIITFWVSRMIFSGLEYTGKKPFDTVLIHGLLRDELGRKMSKSLGNGKDPLELIGIYGTDALRLTLVTGNSPGNDMRISDEKFEASRNFANKLWNAARFVLMNLSDDCQCALPDESLLCEEDKWVLSLYNTLAGEVRDNLDRFELGIAVAKLYDFTWDVFCDWYIELVKIRLADKESGTGKAAQQVLRYVLDGTLRMLHPFIPFITEEIWQAIPHEGESIMVSDFPEYQKQLSYPESEENMKAVIEAIRALRNRRAEMGVPPSKKAKLFVETVNQSLYQGKEPYFIRLASASEVLINAGRPDGEAEHIITPHAELFIPTDEIVDRKAQKERLEKDLAAAESEVQRAQNKLKNEQFVGKAPAQVIAAEREKLQKNQALVDKLKAALGL